MLTVDNNAILSALKTICPRGKNLESFALHLEKYLKVHDITTHKRIAMFLAHAIHECGHFSKFEENLNYSAEGLAATWPKRYSDNGKPNDLAKAIARKPQEIANHTYANRMGNGNPNSGDGWKYRGRGLFQTTGKTNYEHFCKIHPESNCVLEPDQLALPKWAVAAACVFWDSKDLNKEADIADIKGSTRKINGGENGLKERSDLYVKLLAM